MKKGVDCASLLLRQLGLMHASVFIRMYKRVLGSNACLYPWLIITAEIAMMVNPGHGLSRTIRFMVFASHADDC